MAIQSIFMSPVTLCLSRVAILELEQVSMLSVQVQTRLSFGPELGSLHFHFAEFILLGRSLRIFPLKAWKRKRKSTRDSFSFQQAFWKLLRESCPFSPTALAWGLSILKGSPETKTNFSTRRCHPRCPGVCPGVLVSRRWDRNALVPRCPCVPGTPMLSLLSSSKPDRDAHA